MKKIISLFTILFAFVAISQAQDITGIWKTIDDETGEAKSHVEIYEEGGVYYGKVVKILNEDRKDATCEKCSGELKDKPVLNMIIIRDMKKVRDDAYKGGKILDPNKGKEYKCEIYVKDEGAALKLKGCIGPVCRGQMWYKLN